VCLENELSPEPILVVDEENTHAVRRKLDGRRQPGRAAAEDENLGLTGLDIAHRRDRRSLRQGRQALDRVDLHPGRRRGHACLHWLSVRHHEALGALPVRAEEALGRSVLGMMTEHADPGGE
jgi:hypothetical protein